VSSDSDGDHGQPHHQNENIDEQFEQESLNYLSQGSEGDMLDAENFVATVPQRNQYRVINRGAASGFTSGAAQKASNSNQSAQNKNEIGGSSEQVKSSQGAVAAVIQPIKREDDGYSHALSSSKPVREENALESRSLMEDASWAGADREAQSIKAKGGKRPIEEMKLKQEFINSNPKLRSNTDSRLEYEVKGAFKNEDGGLGCESIESYFV